MGGRDPIDRLRKYMKKNGLWSDDYENKVQAEVAEKVRNAVDKFESVKPPEIKDLFAWTYAELPPNLKKQYEDLARSKGEGTDLVQLNLVGAVRLALKQEMERDPDVVLLGEDIGTDGGVFRATDGLIKEFGENRVIDTPLSESGIVGVAIGLAVYGLKPVAEIQFEGFLYPALDQIISHAGRIRTRSRGRFHVPLVIRFPYGGGIRAPEHHSDSPEALLVHTPGSRL